MRSEPQHPHRSSPLHAFNPTTRRWEPTIATTTNGSAASGGGAQGVAGYELAANPAAALRSPDGDPKQSANSTAPVLTLMTYNVFSGSASSSTPHAVQRTKAVLSTCQRSNACVIALQEVSSPFEQALRKERWFREQYVVTGLADYFATSTNDRSRTTAARGRDANDGCLIAVKKDLVAPQQLSASMLRLPGPQGKVLVVVDLNVGMRIATSHFESLSASASVRKAQYRHALEVLSGDAYVTDAASKSVLRPMSSLLLGDFNHASYTELDALVGNSHRPGAYIDATLPTPHGGNPRTPEWQFRQNPTFGDLFPFFEHSKDKRKPRRIDLILTQRDRFEVARTWTDGDRPLKVDKRRREERRPPDSEKPSSRGPSNGRPSSVTKDKTQKVKLRCREGKNGFCYPSDHLAVLATVRLKPPPP